MKDKSLLYQILVIVLLTVLIGQNFSKAKTEHKPKSTKGTRAAEKSTKSATTDAVTNATPSAKTESAAISEDSLQPAQPVDAVTLATPKPDKSSSSKKETAPPEGKGNTEEKANGDTP